VVDEPTFVPPPKQQKKKSPPKAPPRDPKPTGVLPPPPADYFDQAKRRAEQERKAGAAKKKKQSSGAGAALFWMVLIGGIVALRAGVFDKKKPPTIGVPPSQFKVFTPGDGTSSGTGATRIGPYEGHEGAEFVPPPGTGVRISPPQTGGSYERLRPIPPAPRLGSDTGRPLPPNPPPGYDSTGGTIVWDPSSRTYKFIPNSTGSTGRTEYRR
jgi:hypothetical protein